MVSLPKIEPISETSLDPGTIPCKEKVSLAFMRLLMRCPNKTVFRDVHLMRFDIWDDEGTERNKKIQSILQALGMKNREITREEIIKMYQSF